MHYYSSTLLSFLTRMHFRQLQPPSSRVSPSLARLVHPPHLTEDVPITYLLRYGPEQTRPIFGNRLPPQVLGAQELIQRHLKVVVRLGPWIFPPHCLTILIGTPLPRAALIIV